MDHVEAVHLYESESNFLRQGYIIHVAGRSLSQVGYFADLDDGIYHYTIDHIDALSMLTSAGSDLSRYCPVRARNSLMW